MPLKGSSYKEIVNKKDLEKYHHFGNPFTKNPDMDTYKSYVTSAGTCQGDSGGPVYIRAGKNFIVLGKTLHLLSTVCVNTVKK
jgi:secreted trypsin-like serine protease